MGWEGDFMFIDMKEVVETISKNRKLFEISFGKPEKIKNINLVNFNTIAFAYHEAIGQDMLSEPGEHNNYAVHVYKSMGRNFYFRFLPYFCFKNGNSCYNLLRKMFPNVHFFSEMYSDRKLIKIHSKNLFNFKVNDEIFSVCDLLLKYPDWLYFKNSLKDILHNKQEIVSFANDINNIKEMFVAEAMVFRGETESEANARFESLDEEIFKYLQRSILSCLERNYLENLFYIIKEGNDNKNKILILTSDESATPHVIDY